MQCNDLSSVMNEPEIIWAMITFLTHLHQLSRYLPTRTLAPNTQNCLLNYTSTLIQLFSTYMHYASIPQSFSTQPVSQVRWNIHPRASPPSLDCKFLKHPLLPWLSTNQYASHASQKTKQPRLSTRPVMCARHIWRDCFTTAADIRASRQTDMWTHVCENVYMLVICDTGNVLLQSCEMWW